MDNKKIASELVKLAKELVSGSKKWRIVPDSREGQIDVEYFFDGETYNNPKEWEREIKEATRGVKSIVNKIIKQGLKIPEILYITNNDKPYVDGTHGNVMLSLDVEIDPSSDWELDDVVEILTKAIR